MQERSRRTVEQILDATEAIIAEDGVDAATTREIAERAGVAVPSLYRFFADRDEILDALLETMMEDLEALTEEAEQRFSGGSVEEFVRIEFELHASYYERHPSLARLWFGGRVSPSVVELVRARNHRLAERMGRVLGEAGLVDLGASDVMFDLLVEYGDRTLDIAFRNGTRADHEVLEAGITALSASVEQAKRPPPRRTDRSGDD